MIISQKYSMNESNIRNILPNTSGVYALYASDGLLIYYGMSLDNIQDKLMRHHTGKEGTCTKRAAYFNFEVTPHPVKREKELVTEFVTTFSRRPICNELMS